MARAAALVAFVFALLVLAGPARAAAPNYIMVTGQGLPRPVLLADWNENLDFLLAVAGAPRANRAAVRSLARRPRLDLAEFWGWSGRPRPTRPNQANQHGWFYPARGSRRAVVDVMANGVRVPRVAPVEVLKIFARHGVPTRL